MQDRLRVPAARAAGIFSILISLPAILGLLGDEPGAARVILVCAALAVFMGLFFHAVRGRVVPQPTLVIARPVALDAMIAAARTVADRSDWRLLF